MSEIKELLAMLWGFAGAVAVIWAIVEILRWLFA